MCVVALLSACSDGTVAGGGAPDASDEVPFTDDTLDAPGVDLPSPLDAPGDDVTPTFDAFPDDRPAPIDTLTDTLVAPDVTTFETGASDVFDVVLLDVTPFDRPVDTAAPVDRLVPPDLPTAPDVIVDASAPVDRCVLTVCGVSCVDLNTDVANCGACGTRCVEPTGGAAACRAGRCTVACASGYHPCNGGCAPDVSTATCGTSCTPCPTLANGSPTCDGARCGITCNPGFHPCGAGCVSDASPATCGSSCSPCPAPAGGTATCVAGACGVSCNAGTHLCGSACVSNTSPASCGSSCTPCPTPTNGTATCVSGACSVACNAGFTQVSPTACQRLFCGMPSFSCGGGASCPANSTCVAGGCLCNVGYQAVTCAGAPCTTCPGADFYCTPVFCGAGVVRCGDGGYCPAYSVCFPDSSRCLCAGGLRAVTCAGVPCTSCVFPNWRCIP